MATGRLSGKPHHHSVRLFSDAAVTTKDEVQILLSLSALKQGLVWPRSYVPQSRYVHYVAEDNLKRLIPLPLPPKWWGFKAHSTISSYLWGGDCTQGLTAARQALCQLAYIGSQRHPLSLPTKCATVLHLIKSTWCHSVSELGFHHPRHL